MLPPNFELYLVATFLMCLSAGPNVLLMVSLGLRQGSAAVLRGVVGVVAASLVFLTVSALGVVAALAASPALFRAIRYAGAAYLLYIGARLLLAVLRRPRALPRLDAATDGAPPARTGHGAYWQGFVTHISNPKAVIFWSAILPPFVAMDRPVTPQIVTLGVTGIALDALVLAGYGLFAAAARRAGSGLHAHRWLDGVAGAVFVGLGAWLLAAQR